MGKNLITLQRVASGTSQEQVLVVGPLLRVMCNGQEVIEGEEGGHSPPLFTDKTVDTAKLKLVTEPGAEAGVVRVSLIHDHDRLGLKQLSERSGFEQTVQRETPMKSARDDTTAYSTRKKPDATLASRASRRICTSGLFYSCVFVVRAVPWSVIWFGWISR